MGRGVNGGAALQNEDYLYDADGNLIQRQNNNRALTESFFYDGDNRLYRNNLTGGNYIKVCFGGINGRTAGAVARLYRAGSLGKKEGLLADETLFAGSGFCSQSPQELIFRLPDSGPYDLAVTLPGGKVIERRGVKPCIIKIDESLLKK